MLSLSRTALIGASAALMLAANVASAAAFVSYTIRGTPTIIENSPAAGVTTFGIGAAGQKAALGSSALNGLQMSDIGQLGITRVDDYTRFAAGSGPRVGPYLNFWITDGAGNYAVAANEPSNAEWSMDYEANGGKYSFDWDYLKTKTVKIYENNNKTWLPSLGVGLTFGDLASFLIKPPTAAELAANWGGLGTGAPRDSLNTAYGVNWVFGDTLANYVTGGDPGYQVRDAVATAATRDLPEPSSLALVGLALFGLNAARRRKAH